MPKQLIFIAGAIIALGALPLPYGYYTFLRLVACGVFAWAAFIGFERKHKVLPWVYGILAILFNPFMKIHLPKEVWAVVDIASAAFLLLTSSKIVEKDSAESQDQA